MAAEYIPAVGEKALFSVRGAPEYLASTTWKPGKPNYLTLTRHTVEFGDVITEEAHSNSDYSTLMHDLDWTFKKAK